MKAKSEGNLELLNTDAELSYITTYSQAPIFCFALCLEWINRINGIYSVGNDDGIDAADFVYVKPVDMVV